MNVRTLLPIGLWSSIARSSNAIFGGLLVAVGLTLLVALRLGWIDFLSPAGQIAEPLPAEQTASAALLIELTVEKLAATELSTTIVRREPIQPTRSVPGEIQYEATRRVPVNSLVAGVVLEVLVEPGQQVGKHEPLAVLSSPEVGLARDEVLKRAAEQKLARREEERAAEVAANVENLLSLLANRPPLADVEKNLQSRVLGDYREKIVGAYSKLLLAERVREATAALEGGSLSNRLVDERKATREQAAALFQAACETARFAAQQERDRAHATAEQSQRLLSVAEQALTNLLGPLADMRPVTDRQHLSELTLLAPIAGRVEERHAVKAARVAAGGPLFLVADTALMWVAAEIHERDWRALDVVHPGLELPIRIPALGEEQVLSAKVLFVGGQLDADTRSVPLIAELPNTTGRLKPGMFVWTSIPLDLPHDALVIPSGAIMRHENQSFVFVPAGERAFRRVAVQLGIETNARSEILSGLQAGDTVVHRGAFFLKSELLLEREE
jgi:membrane fusion protein, heavy metal efflux system